MAGKSCCGRRWSVLALVVWLAGCSATPSARFYTLRPVGSVQQDAAPVASRAPSVYVKQVELPDYLDRPQIVTRAGENELHFAEYDRWAGPLADEMTAVLAEELGRQLGADRVFATRGLPAEKTGYTVALRVLRLDCTPGKDVLLKAQWVVRCGTDAAIRAATLREPVGDRRYETLVESVGKVLRQAAAMIAHDIPSGSRP